MNIFSGSKKCSPSLTSIIFRHAQRSVDTANLRHMCLHRRQSPWFFGNTGSQWNSTKLSRSCSCPSLLRIIECIVRIWTWMDWWILQLCCWYFILGIPWNSLWKRKCWCYSIVRIMLVWTLQVVRLDQWLTFCDWYWIISPWIEARNSGESVFQTKLSYICLDLVIWRTCTRRIQCKQKLGFAWRHKLTFSCLQHIFTGRSGCWPRSRYGEWNITIHTLGKVNDQHKRPCGWKWNQFASSLIGFLCESRCFPSEPRALASWSSWILRPQPAGNFRFEKSTNFVDSVCSFSMVPGGVPSWYAKSNRIGGHPIRRKRHDSFC